MKTRLNILISGCISFFVGTILSVATGFAPMLLIGLIFLSSFIPMGQGMAMMAVQKQIWMDHIEANIFKANPHLKFAFNADSFVLNGEVLHIPNAGDKPAVKRNRKNLPATVVTRDDSDITVPLDEFTTDPIRIANADKYELTYDKRQSVVGEQSAALDEEIGDWMFRHWSPTLAASILRTTGDATEAHYGVGNRKALKLADVKKAQKIMTKMGVPAANRFACLDADMYDQFTDELSITQSREFSKAFDEKNGVIGKLFGFTFLDSRATVLRYTNAVTPVPLDPDTAESNDDNGGGLFWQKDAVLRAIGMKEMFDEEKSPTYYGDIYSALIRATGRIKRGDGRGVISIVQAAV